MTPSTGTFSPSAVLEIDLDRPLTDLSVERDAQPPYYTRALVLLRIHGRPIELIDIDMPSGRMLAGELARLIWKTHKNAISRHLESDGFEAPDTLGPEGLVGLLDLPRAPCWKGEASPESPPLVSVIIATKDRPEELRKCLPTLLGVEYSNFEVVIVENGSTSTDTKDLIDEIGDSRVRYISEKIAGTSLARNRGLAASRGEIVAFTDDDVIVDKYWLRAIVRQFELHPQVDCVTGLILPAKFDTPAQIWFEEYGGFNKGYVPMVFTRERRIGYTILYPYTAGSFGSGNNAAFRRSALIARGGFDVNLGPGTPAVAGEDLDVFLSVIMDNGSIAYEPAAIIHHFHRSDYEGLRKQLYNYGIGLTAIFTKWSFAHPVHLFEIMRRLPAGIWAVLSPRSTKNRKRSANFPRQLAHDEIRGLLAGPFKYLQSLASSPLRKRRRVRFPTPAPEARVATHNKGPAS